jgi:hypothetical protein
MLDHDAKAATFRIAALTREGIPEDRSGPSSDGAPAS